MAKKARGVRKSKARAEKSAPTVPTPVAPIVPTAPLLSSAVKKKILYRCIAETNVIFKVLEDGRSFGPGQLVDLDETMRDGSKLREHIPLRCFEPISTGGE